MKTFLALKVKMISQRKFEKRSEFAKVIEVLNQQNPTSINRMVRRFRNEKTALRQNKNETKQRVRSNTISSNPSPSIAPTVVGTPPVQSPLLLSQNRRRNPTHGGEARVIGGPPAHNLGSNDNVSINTPETRSLSLNK